MKKVLPLFCVLFATYGVAFSDGRPAFSWDTVPRYMHVRKNTAFTSEELAYLATFPLITFEKTTGSKQFGSTEAGTLVAARAVKQRSPETKILYYRNALVHYGSYRANDALAEVEAPYLVGKKGATNLVRKSLKAYDLTKPTVRSWWLNNAEEVASSPYIDGVFVDGNVKVLVSGYLKRDIGPEKKEAVVLGYRTMMQQLRSRLGPEKLILANIMRARFDESGLEFLTYFDGSYLECFEQNIGKTSRVAYLEKGIAAFQKAARSGKIMAFTLGMESRVAQNGIDEKSAKITDFSKVQGRLDYALGLFLICAEKNSYFMASDGYGVDRNRSGMWLREIPEYSYPLGAPKGAALKKGPVYTRSFAFADVEVDIQNESAQIVWKKRGNASTD